MTKNMIYDCHLHTEFSFDSIEPLKNYINRARSLGVGLIVTDHLDKNLNGVYDSYRDFNPNIYNETYKKYRSDDVLVGIECGMDPRFKDETVEFLKYIDLDFIIGSVHTVYDRDVYPDSCYKGLTKEQFFKEYFNHIYKCLNLFPFIDSLGHIDYPCRYNPYENPGFTYEEFKDELDPIFNYLVEKNIALEFNLNRFKKQIYNNELKSIYLGYKNAGGKYITLGSDSHKSSDFGIYLKKAYEFINTLGLKVVHFKNRKMIID